MEVKTIHPDIEAFIFSLDEHTRLKIVGLIRALEKLGPQMGMPFSKPISQNLFELRVTGKVQVRFLYTFRLGGAVLLNGFVKKSDKIPIREIRLALRRKKALYSR